MTSNSDSPSDSILIIAAEASSCMYAKKFIKQWLELYPNDRFFGVGDREMEAMGVECFGYAEEMGVVGLLEVVKHWKTISGCFRAIEQEVLKREPKFALLLDYPGFNLRLAKSLKNKNVPVVYYISPQLWAWKKGRVKQIKKYIDHMLVVFPFEVEFYKEYGIEAHFVGHPLVEVVSQEKNQVRERESQNKVLGLMPGSRKSEILYNFPAQLAAAGELQKQNSNLEIKVLMAPTLTQSDLQEALSVADVEVSCVQGKPTEMIMNCDYILTASGTATLQVALCSKPMVVMYRMNSLTAYLARKMVNTVDYFCIVNLIAGQLIVPELFQDEANPKNLWRHLKKIMEEPDYTKQMLSGIEGVNKKLGAGGATSNVVNYLRENFKKL